jgi:hypothetical protein
MSPIRALGCLLLAAGCQDDVATPFPEGLEPIEANEVADATGAPLEELRTWSSDGTVKKAHGRAFVFAPPAALWAVMKDPEVMIARCSTDARTFVAANDLAYEFSFLASYTVNMVLTVQWDDQWRFGVVQGTPDAPTLGMARPPAPSSCSRPTIRTSPRSRSSSTSTRWGAMPPTSCAACRTTTTGCAPPSAARRSPPARDPAPVIWLARLA